MRRRYGYCSTRLDHTDLLRFANEIIAALMAAHHKEDFRMESLNLNNRLEDQTKDQKTPLNLVPDTLGRGRAGSDSGSGAATAQARSLYDHAKETAGQAYEAVTDRAAEKLDEQKSTLSGGLTAVADSVRQVSSNLESSRTDSGLAEAAAKYTSSAAGVIEDVASYFDRKGVREMARDVENFARRNPAIFIGAAFGLGLLAARFLKSTPSDSYAGSEERNPAPASQNKRTISSPSGSTLNDEIRNSPA